MNKVILYIATSADGFIADANGGVDWLPQPQNDHELEVVGYKKLMEDVDTVLMGSKSFKQIMSFGEWAWPDKHTYVFTQQALESPLSCISITHEDPHQFMQSIKMRQSGKDIWLLGGAKLAASFACENLVDVIVLTIVPQNLREGIPLDLSLDDFDLQEEKHLMDGMVQKIYLKKA